LIALGAIGISQGKRTRIGKSLWRFSISCLLSKRIELVRLNFCGKSS
jgi:hypothetical protein